MSVLTGDVNLVRGVCARNNGSTCGVSCLLSSRTPRRFRRRTVTRRRTLRILCFVLPHVHGRDFLGKLNGTRLVESSNARLVLNSRVRMHSFTPSRVGGGCLHLTIGHSRTLIQPFSCSAFRRILFVPRRILGFRGLGLCRLDDSLHRLKFCSFHLRALYDSFHRFRSRLREFVGRPGHSVCGHVRPSCSLCRGTIGVLRRRLPLHLASRGLFEITGGLRVGIHSFCTSVCALVNSGVLDGCRAADNCFPTG